MQDKRDKIKGVKSMKKTYRKSMEDYALRVLKEYLKVLKRYREGITKRVTKELNCKGIEKVLRGHHMTDIKKAMLERY